MEKLGLVAQIHVLPFSVNVTFNLLNSTSRQTLSKSALTFIPKMQDSFEENLQFVLKVVFLRRGSSVR